MQNNRKNIQIPSDTEKMIVGKCARVFKLPPGSHIKVHRHKSPDKGEAQSCTILSIKLPGSAPAELKVPCSPEEITEEILINIRHELWDAFKKNHPVRSRIYSMFGWWAIFAGSLAFVSVCPICGSTACPVGFGITGLLSGMLAFIKTFGSSVKSRIKMIFIRD